MTSSPDSSGHAESVTLSARDRWRTLVGAGLGWTFDGYETYALVLTLGVSLPQLLPAEDHDRIPFFAGATIALTLFGFGLGGIGGGILADRFGRRRTSSSPSARTPSSPASPRSRGAGGPSPRCGC